MKPGTAISALLLLAMGAGADGFYVWQQAWTSNVVCAVADEPATTMYPLAAVVPDSGDSRIVDIPWQRLSTLKHRMVPVIRIPLDAFKRHDISTELVRITDEILKAAAPCRPDEIQFDLDCPERLLPEYTDLITDFRRRRPDLHLSVTVLPCHLNNRTFRALAAVVDWYVVQVHGIDVPGHLDDPAALLDMRIAEKAIDQAEELETPYCIALPCYAYELNFDPDTGRFLFLTAEHPAHQRDTIRKRIAADEDHLLKLLQESGTLKHSRGIIWFRLPVAGDRLCLPRDHLAKLQRGISPAADIECRSRRISNTTIELELYNGNVIDSATATLTIDWPLPCGSYDLYRDISSAGRIPGRLPAALTVPLPPPGRIMPIGWFQTTQPPTLNMRLR